MTPLDLTRYERIVVLTGAGISVASGLRPYRGPGGLWQDPELAALSHAERFARDPGAVWSFFGGMRVEVLRAEPNDAHGALASAQRALRAGQSLTVLTQNVDRLHERAGTAGVVALHGDVLRTRCSRPGCTLAPYEDHEAHTGVVPRCPACGAPLRPDVVLFEEPLAVDAEWAAKKALRGCDLFLAVGTSGTVSPASNYVRSAAYEGARTILVNLDPMAPRNPAFHEEHLGRAEEILPKLLNGPRGAA